VLGTLLAMGFVICLVIFHNFDRWADLVLDGWLVAHMRLSQWFVGDLMLATIFAMNIFTAKFARLEFGVMRKPIKFLASFTFIFYMAHGLLITISIRYFGLSMVATSIVALSGSF